MIEEFGKRLVELQVKRPYIFLLVFAVITVLLVPGIPNLINNVEPSLEKVLPSSVKEVKTMNDMRAQFGADMLYLVVYAKEPVYDVRQPELLKYIDHLSEKFRTRENILEVRNLADLVKESNNNVIPASLVETREIIDKHPLSSQFVNPDFSFSVIQIRSDTGAAAQVITKVVNSIKEDIELSEEFNPGSTIQITGFNAIDKATFEVIISDFMIITAISMLFIAVIVLFTFRSLMKGFLPMVVVFAALMWTMGLIGYLGMTITVVSMVSAAMIMGLGIDFGIHVVHSYYEFRKKHNPKKSMKETMAELLRAFIAASLTTSAGFLALLFGVLPAMQNLGIILALGIIFTLIGAVFLLPVIVYLYDTKIYNVKIHTTKISRRG